MGFVTNNILTLILFTPVLVALYYYFFLKGRKSYSDGLHSSEA